MKIILLFSRGNRFRFRQDILLDLFLPVFFRFLLFLFQLFLTLFVFIIYGRQGSILLNYSFSISKSLRAFIIAPLLFHDFPLSIPHHHE
jgi:hypothetical protein